MTSASAGKLQSLGEALREQGFEESVTSVSGAQTLLLFEDEPWSRVARGGVLFLYLAAAFALSTYMNHPVEVAPEMPLELVFEPPAQEEPPALEPQQEEPAPIAENVLSEPEAVPEPLSPDTPPKIIPPAAEKKPEPQKPEPKKIAKKVEHRATSAAPRPAAPLAAEGARAAVPDVITSAYANLVQARIARAAANSYPRSAMQRGETSRVLYHIVIGPSGDLISRSITPTGNAAFDSAAAEALTHAGPFPPSGARRPISLSGAISYRLR